jgi:dolichol-phosphate mannosyltransferase
MRKIAIIPVYRDTDKLVHVLAKFPKNVVDEICLVVDCPTINESREISATKVDIGPRIHTIINKTRMGVGYAIRKGIEHALAEKYEVAVIMAGNDKDDPREIPRFLEAIESEGYDYVQGSRFLRGGKHVKNPLLRNVFSRVYPLFWTLSTNVKCTDVTNGFRTYRLKIFCDKRVNIWQDWLDDYQLEYYIHYKVLTLGYRMKEVPVSKTYPYRHKGGYSHISPFRDWWKIIGPLIYLKLGVKS